MVNLWRLGPRIDTDGHFGPRHGALSALLHDLPEEAWNAATPCPGWAVRDITAHIVGDHLGRLARGRDGHDHPESPRPREPLPQFIDRLNQRMVDVARGWSTRILLDQLEHTGRQIVEFWDHVDMDALGEPVTWASPEPAPAWLDAARDFTEYWTHEQQIRDAVNRPGGQEPPVAHLVIDTFLRALPQTLNGVDGGDAPTLLFTVSGPGGGDWTCTWDPAGWSIDRRMTSTPDAIVVLDTDTTWRLATRGIEPDEARRRAVVHNPGPVTDRALTLLSIIR